MVVHFYDKIQLQSFKLYEARHVAALSFRYHKSVNHLDLNTNEYGLRKKSIFTKEGLRKWILPKRKILYQYNLELPTDLEKYYSKEKFDIVRENTFHLYQIFICDSVYNHGLEEYIVQEIKKGTNKIEKLKRSMKIMKLLNFHRFSTPAMYLYDNIFPILMIERCTDSNLVVNFARLFSFHLWIMNRECPNILYYVLVCAQTDGSSLSSLSTDFRINPVNAYFVRHKIVLVQILLRFGAYSGFPRMLDFNSFLRRIPVSTRRAVWRRSADPIRAFFLLQLYYDFRYHRNLPEGLRCIWRCVKDPFLSRTEIVFALSALFRQEFRQEVKALIAYYQHYIIEKGCTSKPSPRTLKAICRVEVRRLLNFNHQLPFGIYSLNIPNELEEYLNLFE